MFIKFNAKSDRKILFYSDYLASIDRNHAEIARKLNEPDYKDILTEKEKKEIDRNSDVWLKQSRNEWVLKKKVAIKDKSIDKCQLCNTRLRKEKWKIQNKKNEKNLWIGRDCGSNIISLSEQGNNKDTADQAKRRELLYSGSRKLREVTDGISNFDLYTRYVLTQPFNDRVGNLKKKIKICIDDYIQKDLKHDLTHVIDAYNIEFLRLQKEYNRYNSDVATDGQHLPIQIATKIKKQRQGTALIREVQNNKGMLDKRIASKITIPEFLDLYREQMNDRLGYTLCKSVEQARIILNFSLRGKKLEIKYNSGAVISSLGFPVELSDTKSEQDIYDILRTSNTVITDVSTKEFMNQLVENTLKKLRITRCDSITVDKVRKYILSKEKYDKGKKTNTSTRVIENKLRKYHLWIDINRNIILNLEPQIVISTGQELLVSVTEDKYAVDSLLNNAKRYSEDELLQKIYMDIQVEDARFN